MSTPLSILERIDWKIIWKSFENPFENPFENHLKNQTWRICHVGPAAGAGWPGSLYPPTEHAHTPAPSPVHPLDWTPNIPQTIIFWEKNFAASSLISYLKIHQWPIFELEITCYPRLCNVFAHLLFENRPMTHFQMRNHLLPAIVYPFRSSPIWKSTNDPFSNKKPLATRDFIQFLFIPYLKID